MQLIEIADTEKWNDIIKKFSNYDIYYQPEYTKGFQIHGDGLPILFYFEGKNMKAVNVAMKRDISYDSRFLSHLNENSLFDITTPYGYGGFFFEGDLNKEELNNCLKEYEEVCLKENIVSEFVRFHPVLHNHISAEFLYNTSVIGKTVTVNLQSREQIWNDLHSKNRNVIRKAIKSGVQIYWGREESLFEQFIQMYNTTMERDQASNYYYFEQPFYKSILNDLKYSATMFYAVLEGSIIAMSIVLHSNRKLNYHLSATDRDYQRFAPTNLLLYEAACWGYENGFDTFHLGGGIGSKEDNLYKFKKAFNKNHDNDFAIGRKIFSEENNQDLIAIRKKSDPNFNENSEFFPTYRS